MKETITSIDVYQAGKRFWMEQLKDLQMTSSHLFPAATTSAGAEMLIDFPIEPELAGKLLKMSHHNDLLLYVLLLSVTGILINKYTSSRDVAIAGPTYPGPNREHVFNDCILFRCRIPDGASAREFLEINKKCVVESYQNQHYPLRNVFSSPGFEEFRGFAPQTLLSLNTIHPRTSGPGSRKPHQICFDVERTDRMLHLSLRFDESAFDVELVRNAGHHFVTICGEVVANRQRTIRDIEFLGKAERETIISAWNDTEGPPPPMPTLHTCFEATAAVFDGAVAVVQGKTSITYSDLNVKAEKLARHLKGVLKETGRSNNLVGIYLDPSIDLVVGILATLKAGAAYVPISKEQPDVRIGHILDDAEIDVLLVDGEIGGDTRYTGRTISVVTPPEGTIGFEESLPETRSDDLAYVIYTSGSTGTPKGVMVEHRGVVNSTIWRNLACGLGPSDRMLNLFAYGFDGFNSLLFSALLSGGQIVFPEAAGLLDLDDITRMIERYSITNIAIIPSMYQLLLDTATRTGLSSIRLVLLAAESSSAALIAKSRDLAPHITLLNEYGPTENSVVSLAHFDMDANNPSVVGRPISNTQAYVLGKDLSLLPVGATGEICVSGIGLGRGYLNRPDQTNERFVPHPFRPNERLYKTGDLGRYRSDGSIEFCGRADQQVKIRGHRVELEEIERCFEGLPDIRRAVVSVHQGSLVAYFIQAEGERHLDLRSRIDRLLPHYMVPAHFVEVKEFALTQSGKIDRSALPAPEALSPASGRYRAPATEVERILAAIWEALLGKSRVGADDNFFELGGDSIKALQLIAMLREKGYECSIHSLFENPSINRFSHHLTKRRSEIPQDAVIGPVVLTPIQWWLFDQDLSVIHHFNQSVMLFREGGFDVEVLARVFGKLVAHHDALRMTFRVRADGVEQKNRGLEHRAFEIEVFDFSASPADEAEASIRNEVERLQGSIDLAHGPLVKCGLFRTSSGEHLLIAIHHLVVDGYSWRILLEDFQTAYAQALQNSPLQLPPKTSSFQTWAMRLGEFTRSLSDTPELAYWNKAVALIESKTTRAAAADSAHGGLASAKWSIEAHTTQRLVRTAAEAHQTTVETLLLAALGLAWRKLKSEDGVALWVEGHGREDLFEDVFVGRTIGWFTTQYPVWLPVPAEDCDLAIALTKSTLEEVPNRGLGFGVLKYLAGGPADPVIGRFTPPRILFNYLGHLDVGDAGDSMLWLSQLSVGAGIHPQWQSPYHLSVGVSITAGKTEVFLQYDNAVLSDRDIARFSNIYRALLEQIASASERQPGPGMEVLSGELKRREYYTRARPGAPKVFFFPPKMSLGLSYYLLAHHLTKAELVAFDFIERPSRIDTYLEYITGMQERGPYVLGGYSSAALVFELARAMRERGLTVSDIILLDAKPNVSITDSVISEIRAAESIEFFLKAMKPFVGAFDDDFTRTTGSKIRKYSRYISNTCNDTILDTTFHFIKSRSSVEEDLGMCQELSSRKMCTYEGFGDHSFMLNGAAARGNAAIIGGIIEGATRRSEDYS